MTTLKTSQENNPIKKPDQKTSFTKEMEEELVSSAMDPFYFIKNFVKIQHPIKGSVPFTLFEYQERIVNAFWANRSTVLLAGRQLGKSVTSKTNVLRDNLKVEISTLIPLTLRQKIVRALEETLLRLCK